MKKEKRNKAKYPHSDTTYMMYRYFGELKFIEKAINDFTYKAFSYRPRNWFHNPIFPIYNKIISKLDVEIYNIGLYISSSGWSNSVAPAVGCIENDLKLTSEQIWAMKGINPQERQLFISFLKRMLSKLQGLKSKFVEFAEIVMFYQDFPKKCAAYKEDFHNYMAEVELFHKEKYLQHYESWI